MSAREKRARVFFTSSLNHNMFVRCSDGGRSPKSRRATKGKGDEVKDSNAIAKQTKAGETHGTTQHIHAKEDVKPETGNSAADGNLKRSVKETRSEERTLRSPSIKKHSNPQCKTEGQDKSATSMFSDFQRCECRLERISRIICTLQKKKKNVEAPQRGRQNKGSLQGRASVKLLQWPLSNRRSFAVRTDEPALPFLLFPTTQHPSSDSVTTPNPEQKGVARP